MQYHWCRVTASKNNISEPAMHGVWIHLQEFFGINTCIEPENTWKTKWLTWYSEALRFGNLQQPSSGWRLRRVCNRRFVWRNLAIRELLISTIGCSSFCWFGGFHGQQWAEPRGSLHVWTGIECEIIKWLWERGGTDCDGRIEWSAVCGWREEPHKKGKTSHSTPPWSSSTSFYTQVTITAHSSWKWPPFNIFSLFKSL